MAVRKDVVERVGRALNFETPDRVPVWEALENEAVYQHFAPGVPFPECAAIACEQLGIDATYGCMMPAAWRQPGAHQIIAAQTVWDTRPVFRDLDDLRRFRPPRIDASAIEERLLAAHAAIVQTYEPHTLYLPQNGGWGFLPGYDTTTFTVVALAIAHEIDALERFWDYRAECAMVRNRITAKHRLAPAVQCCEDVAYKTGLLVSPQLLHEQFFPRCRYVIAPLKAAGIKVIWHSDGNIMPVLDAAIACGFDGINPLERSAGMDSGLVRRRYGRQLILVGNVETRVLRWGTEAAVRAAVRDSVEAAQGAHGGMLLQCDSGELMPDTPVQNAIAYLDAARHPPGELSEEPAACPR